MKSIFEDIYIHQKQNLPFVVYRKPNSKSIIGIFQQDNHLYFSDDLSEKAFVFTPFSGASIIFPFEKSKVKFNSVYFKESIEFENEIKNALNEEDKIQFENSVEKAITFIKDGFFSKVVLSRKEIVNLESFDLQKVFERVLYKYTNAFCYCWFHPKVGMWIGASPEKLFLAKENDFQTMALAGTQINKKEEPIVWKVKEIEEQLFVTDFIVNQLKDEVETINVSDSYTTQAGNLLHLRTDIEGKLKKETNLKNIIDVMHPTPAVCGLPKEEAKKYIEENEGYNREFYTGYLGEINYDFNTNGIATDLFVNLRCMKIEANQAHIYVGCGVTKDSNTEAEWIETVNKSKIMKQVL